MMGNRLSDTSSASLSIQKKDYNIYFEQSSQYLRMIKVIETSIALRFGHVQLKNQNYF